MHTFTALWNIREGVSEREFEDWYAGRHVADAQKIPGLIAYSTHRATDPSAPYYRMALLGFRDEAEFAAAFASPEWKHAFEDAQPYITDHLRLWFESETVVSEGVQP